MTKEGINGKTYKKIAIMNKVEFDGKTYKKNCIDVSSTFTLGVYNWGIFVMIEDKYPKMPNSTFYRSRRFKLCKSSPTYDSIVKRIEKYYKLVA